MISLLVSAIQYQYLLNALFFVFLTALSAVLTFFCRKYLQIMDRPSSRSLHERPVPRSGGIAIVLTYMIGIGLYYYLHDSYFIGQQAFWGLFLSSLLIAAVSLYDDLTDRALIFKLASQLIGVAILLGFGLTLNEWYIPGIGIVSFGIYRYILTILWIVGITNAFNFMDGSDGLAAGVAVIVSLTFMFITFGWGSGVAFHISYIIAASCIGFIFFNFPKASIFMGDVGSTLLGFCFGALAILAAHYDAYHTPFAVMPILFANFIMETFFTFIWRFLSRQSVHRAHKLHPYQLLRQMGVSAKAVAIFYYAQNIALAFICVLYLRATVDLKMMIVITIVALYLLYFLKVHEAARKRGLIDGKRTIKIMYDKIVALRDKKVVAQNKQGTDERRVLKCAE